MSAPERLSADDARILKSERGVIRGHTCKVLVLERSSGRPLPTLESLRRHVESRLDAAPRLRQRVVATPLRAAGPVWLDDASFDIARHVRPAAVARPLGAGRLEETVAELMASTLDRARPLWQLEVVERLDDDAMALIWRVHHAVADGTTCMRLGSEILWDEDPEPGTDWRSLWTPRASPTRLALLASGLAQRARHRSAPSPPQAARGASWATMRAVVRRELAPRAVLTSLAPRVGAGRSVAFTRVPLEDCKRAAKSIGDGVTVNDVVLGIMAGAVREWLGQDRARGTGIRVKVPVSLHQPGEGAGFGNRDSYFFVDLPVAEPDPLKRVLAINRETRERKLGHDAETLYRLGMHTVVARWAMSPKVFAFNISNVRGPAGEVFVLGARVRAIYSLAEVAHHHALRVAVISAGGLLCFGLCADRDEVRDLPLLAEGLDRATDELLSRLT